MIKSLKRLNNESGMVLMIVIMTVVIMMVFSIGVISRGVSQTKSSEIQVGRIKAEQLAAGAYAKAYSDQAAGQAMTATVTANLDGKHYSASVADTGATGAVRNISVTAPF